ncbi:hypothetical protein GMES_0974 [Paraglaciecola mesophila KMM 241]|uniref:Uncharacterized protein n=1 Tax=Paraglaciecola mesophila KMM 241 TaxID=1128912 RepID=K6Z2Q5_9ALTE|nr:hypothetical protein GMES_0974 [Paraglaciecola mesophila KMM 241]
MLSLHNHMIYLQIKSINTNISEESIHLPDNIIFWGSA